MVETSRDNLNWDVDATYQYYLHGPLMRAEIGDLKVQGVDFAYTLHGWIKGVNAGILDPDRDMGKDGKVSTGNLNQLVARDAFGYILGYYSNPGSSVEDYTAINSSGTNHFAPNTGGSDLMNFRENLYNGNITSMQTVLPNCSTYNASRTISSESFGNAYNYDQLNRIKSSRTFTNLNTTTNAWGSTGMVSQDFSTNYVYDANGNITNLTRWGNGTQMDEFSYNYNIQSGKMQSNRLYHVNDNVALNSNYSDDIDDQGTFNSTASTINTANNYGYDELGNLTRDDAEQISSIEWNVQGKITKVNRTIGSTKPTLEFTYDAMGQRLSKKVTESTGDIKTFYYIRDAQGNEMCRYVAYTESGDNYFVSEEHSIYGSSRLGLQTRRDTLYKNTVITPSFDYVFRDLGTKQYEMSNHLGNVLVTVTDQNKPVSAGGITIDSYNPVIVSISDYYPFGSLMPTRSWSDASRAYRYGFNGKEKENETANDDYDFGARIYDGRLGRWLSVDPLMKKYSDISPYVGAGNCPILFFDVNGKEIIINDQGVINPSKTGPSVIQCLGDAARVYYGIQFTPDGYGGYNLILNLNLILSPQFEEFLAANNYPDNTIPCESLRNWIMNHENEHVTRYKNAANKSDYSYTFNGELYTGRLDVIFSQINSTFDARRSEINSWYDNERQRIIDKYSECTDEESLLARQTELDNLNTQKQNRLQEIDDEQKKVSDDLKDMFDKEADQEHDNEFKRAVKDRCKTVREKQWTDAFIKDVNGNNLTDCSDSIKR